MEVGLADADLLVSLTAIGRSMQAEFEPQRFLDEDGRTFTVFAEHAPPGILLHEEHYTTTFAPLGRFVVAECVLRHVFAGEVLLIHDFSTDPRLSNPNPLERKLLKAGIRSGVSIPLKSGGRIIGALAATSLALHAYTETHLATLRQIANVIVPFIQSTILLHRERQRQRRLRVLGTLAEVLATSLDARDVFGRLAAAVKPILDFDRMVALLVSASGRDLELLATAGMPDVVGPPERISLEHYSFTPRVASGEAVVIQDAAVELDPSLPGDRRILDSRVRSCLIVPLRFGDQFGGGLYFGKRWPYCFDTLDVELATGIAAQVVVAVQHQRLAEDHKRLTLADLERRAIRAALERTKGNKTQAAAILGISRTKLHTRLKRFGLAPEAAV